MYLHALDLRVLDRPVARPGVRHSERAALDLVLVDLVLELVARPARAGAVRAPALNHEVADHAVEDEPVVEAVARQLLEVLDRLRRVRVEQLDLDRPVVGVHRRVAHALFVTSTWSSAPRAFFPETVWATSSARSAGTSTNEKRSSTLTLRTSSFSRCVLSTTARTRLPVLAPLLDLGLGMALDRLELAALLRRDQGDCAAALARAAGPADAVDVDVGRVRHVVVHDGAHPGVGAPAGRHIRGHE